MHELLHLNVRHLQAMAQGNIVASTEHRSVLIKNQAQAYGGHTDLTESSRCHMTSRQARASGDSPLPALSDACQLLWGLGPAECWRQALPEW